MAVLEAGCIHVCTPFLHVPATPEHACVVGGSARSAYAGSSQSDAGTKSCAAQKHVRLRLDLVVTWA
jgi:hypothetical protein